MGLSRGRARSALSELARSAARLRIDCRRSRAEAGRAVKRPLQPPGNHEDSLCQVDPVNRVGV